MYEYDEYPTIAPEIFVPEPGQAPDFPPAEQADDTLSQWDVDVEFEQLFRQPAREEPPAATQRSTAPRVDRRRRRQRTVPLRWPLLLGVAIAGTTAIVSSTVSVLGALVSYNPLRELASPTAHDLASAWPLLIYGPWFVGCLSILHAAAHRRQVRAAWITVIVFSLIAMALCIDHAPRTLTAIATAGLPPVSALVSFHLLFRQITLLHPRHAKIPHQRKH
ncbi:hypothetical protein GA0115240_11499 [Streptomyces sp. DvalAA-14]|uniref:DUF2637 domain-containing protein n=1 Tax=unclassified Streptomyces TaxID=2593676 RepID=UPI00081B2BD4|nr:MULTISPECIES: DUF2637 domain-containing protein [unclassified Streptomyces]MYS19919.1 hypothetical protein [Streptomyces sp. SID4948]SCD56560.1 hypothetical protein GA0115240_11499 [Streptomyces sp. DvalAA-14]